MDQINSMTEVQTSELQPEQSSITACEDADGQDQEQYPQRDHRQQNDGKESHEASDQIQGKEAEISANNEAFIVPRPDDDRKLFVGGITWDTTFKDLKDYFETYGSVQNINVKLDPRTGRPRGFAFVLFSSADSVDKVLSTENHIIKSKKVEPKRARARNGKIFVGGLLPDMSESVVRSYFSRFGKICEVEMPFDLAKNQRKPFCFVTFESEQVAQEILKTPKRTINSKEVVVKKALNRFDSAAAMRGGRRSHPGYFGEGWGYRGQEGGYNPLGYGGYGCYDCYEPCGSYTEYDYPMYPPEYRSYSTGGAKHKKGSHPSHRYQPY